LNLRTRCLPFLISYRSPYPRTTHAPEANRVRSRAGGTTNGDKATKAMSTTKLGGYLVRCYVYSSLPRDRMQRAGNASIASTQ
jgi:hypothetical protein